MSAALASASGPAPMGVDRGSSPSTPAQQRARLDRLQDLDGGALREEWRRLLSRCGTTNAERRRLRNCHAAATAVRHVLIAAARSARCAWAEVRWRWTLKVL